MLQNLNNVSRWAVQTVKPLDTHSTERVILLGDAVRLPPSMEKKPGTNIQ